MQRVHLRVNDAARGQPTPVRLRVTDAAGNYYAPLGRLTHFATGPNQDVGGNVLLGGKAWAYIDGTCEILLPPGLLHFSIRKGPEYEPLDSDLELVAGKLALRFEIRRWIDMRREGWHCGDTRVHFLSPHAALLEAQAEGVAFVQLLARVTRLLDAPGGEVSAIPNLLAFSGQKPCLEAPGHAVAVNTENFHPELGNLGLLHCHRVVYPLAFGGPEGVEDWTLQDWCGQCHRKKGLVIWTRTDHESPDFRWGEPLVDLLLGEVDAFELTTLEGSAFETWRDLLNTGVRVPLVGASGKESNREVLGSPRTYVCLPPGQDATLPAWIEGIRAGRTFITEGPLLDFTVNGRPPGSVVKVERGTVQVRAQAKSWDTAADVVLLRNGVEIHRSTGIGNPPTAMIEMGLPVEESCWLAAAAKGARSAHTSPVYIEIAGRPPLIEQGAVTRLLAEIERMREWCRSKARFSTPQMQERLTAGFLQARDVLARRMCSP